MTDEAAQQPAPEGRSSLWHTLLDKARLRHRASRQRRRRVRLIVVLALLLLLVGAYLYMTSDRQVERLVEEYLQNLFGTTVRIRSAHFSFFSGLELTSIRVVLDDSAPPVFQADGVRLTHDPLALLVGRLKVSEIVAVNPRINLEKQDGAWNFQRLFPAKKGGPTVQQPVIYVEDGVLTLRQIDAGRQVYEHELKLTGVVQPDAARTGVFGFFASRLEGTGFRGHISRGLIDTGRQRVVFEGRATNVRLSKELADTLPPEARAIWDRFGPEGRVGIRLAFSNQGSGPGDIGFRVEVNLNGVSLSYRHQGHVFHLRNLTGQCFITPKDLHLRNVHGVLATRLAHAGEAEGAEATDAKQASDETEEVALTVGLSGRITAIDTDCYGQDLSITVEDLDMARIRPLVADLWPGGDDFYKSFEPQGRMDVNMHFVRAPRPDAEPQISGELRIKDARTVNVLFPYPVEGASGTVRLSPGLVEVVSLDGVQGPAAIHSSGRILDPGTDREQIDLVVKGRRVPLDERVRSALRPHFADALAVYDSLHPEGEVNVSAHIVRQANAPSERGDVVIDIDLIRAAVSYDGFPYRMTDCTGRLRIEGDRTDIDVTGRHGPADVAVRGFVQGRRDRPVVDLRITGRGVPLDDHLAAALPESQRAIYRQYHPSGRADMTVHVAQSAETEWQLTHKADIDLDDVGLVFEDFPFPVEGISGRMEITPGRFLIKDLCGTNAEAVISASGSVAHTGETYAADLTLQGRNVLLDRDLRGAIALVAPGLWDNIHPEGRVDVVCRLTHQAGDAGPLRAQVTLDARDVSVVYKHFPYPLHRCRGRLIYDGSRVTIERLENTEGATTIRLSGVIELPEGGPMRSDLSIEADGLEVDDALIDALPEAFAGALEALDVRARVNVRVDRLTYEADPDGPPRIQWSGSAVMDNGSVDLGVPVDRVVAYVRLSGSYGEAGLGLDGTVDMPQGRIDGKEVTCLHAELRQQPGSPRVAVTRLEADCYGGRIELQGEGRLVVGDRSSYGLSVLVRDVDFGRFAREGLGLDLPGEGGRLSGEFALWGAGVASDQVVARAEFNVTDADLYRLPAVVKVLNVLRLQAGATTFDNAGVKLFVRNRTYVFDEIVLRGKGLSVHGAGRLEPDGRLNLVFTPGTGRAGGVVPALDDLAQGVLGELVLVEVTGTMRHPKVEQHSFRGLTAPLRELKDLIDESRRLRRQGERQR